MPPISREEVPHVPQMTLFFSLCFKAANYSDAVNDRIHASSFWVSQAALSPLRIHLISVEVAEVTNKLISRTPALSLVSVPVMLIYVATRNQTGLSNKLSIRNSSKGRSHFGVFKIKEKRPLPTSNLSSKLSQFSQIIGSRPIQTKLDPNKPPCVVLFRLRMGHCHLMTADGLRLFLLLRLHYGWTCPLPPSDVFSASPLILWWHSFTPFFSWWWRLVVTPFNPVF